MSMVAFFVHFGCSLVQATLRMSDMLPDATCKREMQAQRARRTENGERKWKRKRIKRSCAKILIKSQKRLTVKYAASRPHIRERTKKSE